MYDHYNTATVLREVPGHQGTWQVRTTDGDGQETTYDYAASELRPAAAPVEFRW
jgi:hypothetical protein